MPAAGSWRITVAETPTRHAAESQPEFDAAAIGQVRRLGAPVVQLGNEAHDVQAETEVRRLAGSGLPMVDYDPAEALATFDYFIGTSSPVVAAQLEALGGRRMGRPSWLGELVGGSEARVYVFSERTIATFDVPGPRPLLEHSPYRDVLSIQAGAHF